MGQQVGAVSARSGYAQWHYLIGATFDQRQYMFGPHTQRDFHFVFIG